MNRLYSIVALLLGLLVAWVGPVLAQQGSMGSDFETNHGWPFGDDPRDPSVAFQRDDVVITLGATAFVPGSVVDTGLEILFGVDPLYTESRTELTITPTFAATQSLETGLVFDWWSSTVDVDLSLMPWSLTSISGWLEMHPPEWVILTKPWISLEGDIGWGPQWLAVADWSHELAGSLDILALWKLSTLWESSLDLSVESNLDAIWALPDGAFVTSWMVQLDARSILPLFENSPMALRAGVRAQVHLLPTFGFGFDVRFELRANAFTAYGLVGAGDAGIRAEFGLEWSIGFSLFD